MDVLDDLLHLAIRSSAWILAPNSLILGASSERGATLEVTGTRPGDIILVLTPGSIFNFWRRLTGQLYDHAAVCVSSEEVVHIGPPKCRLAPVSRLLQPHRRPIVLRPKLSQEERDAFIANVRAFLGRSYHMLRVLSLIGVKSLETIGGHWSSPDSFLLSKVASIRRSMSTSPASASSQHRPTMICSHAIMYDKFLIGVATLPAHATIKDYKKLGMATINDFFWLHHRCPTLLNFVILRPMTSVPAYDGAPMPATEEQQRFIAHSVLKPRVVTDGPSARPLLGSTAPSLAAQYEVCRTSYPQLPGPAASSPMSEEFPARLPAREAHLPPIPQLSRFHPFIRMLAESALQSFDVPHDVIGPLLHMSKKATQHLHTLFNSHPVLALAGRILTLPLVVSTSPLPGQSDAASSLAPATVRLVSVSIFTVLFLIAVGKRKWVLHWAYRLVALWAVRVAFRTYKDLQLENSLHSK